MTTTPTRAQAFAVLSDFEPPICDLHVDVMTMDTVWEAIGNKRADRSIVLSLDEHEQMTRLMGSILAQSHKLKAQLYASLREGGDK